MVPAPFLGHKEASHLILDEFCSLLVMNLPVVSSHQLKSYQVSGTKLIFLHLLSSAILTPVLPLQMRVLKYRNKRDQEAELRVEPGSHLT